MQQLFTAINVAGKHNVIDAKYRLLTINLTTDFTAITVAHLKKI